MTYIAPSTNRSFSYTFVGIINFFNYTSTSKTLNYIPVNNKMSGSQIISYSCDNVSCIFFSTEIRLSLIGVKII